MKQAVRSGFLAVAVMLYPGSGFADSMPVNKANDALLKLPATAQANIIGGAIDGAVVAGGVCVGKKATYIGILPIGPDKGAGVWNVQCVDGRRFAVELLPDAIGTTKYTLCDETKTAKDSACFRNFVDPKRPATSTSGPQGKKPIAPVVQ